MPEERSMDVLAVGPVVEDNDLFAAVADDFHVGVVSRMGNVGVAVGFVFERDDENVGEAIGLAFCADVRAVLETDDRIDLLRQAGNGVDDFLELGGCHIVVELVHDDVAEDLFSSASGSERHKNQRTKDPKNQKETAAVVHDTPLWFFGSLVLGIWHGGGSSKERVGRIRNLCAFNAGERRELMIVDSLGREKMSDAPAASDEGVGNQTAV